MLIVNNHLAVNDHCYLTVFCGNDLSMRAIIKHKVNESLMEAYALHTVVLLLHHNWDKLLAQTQRQTKTKPDRRNGRRILILSNTQ